MSIPYWGRFWSDEGAFERWRIGPRVNVKVVSLPLFSWRFVIGRAVIIQVRKITAVIPSIVLLLPIWWGLIIIIWYLKRNIKVYDKRSCLEWLTMLSSLYLKSYDDQKRGQTRAYTCIRMEVYCHCSILFSFSKSAVNLEDHSLVKWYSRLNHSGVDLNRLDLGTYTPMGLQRLHCI